MTTRLLKIDATSWASIANLGPGFDCLALAVDLSNRFTIYVNVRNLVSREKEFQISLTGGYAEVDPKLKGLDGNLFYRSFSYVVKYLCEQKGWSVPKHPIMIHQEVSIPPLRGLGSSSSACVAGVIAAVHFLDAIFPGGNFLNVLEKPDLCAGLAMHTDPCPDNICACLTGGLTYSFVPESDPLSDPDPCLPFFRQEIEDGDLRIVALVPANLLSTRDARKVLAGTRYSCREASFNICRSTCMPAVFREKRYDYLKEVMKDRIHQRQRASEFYKDDCDKEMNLDLIFDRVIEAGAYAACISGSGSTLVAFTKSSNVFDVEIAFRKAFKESARANWTIDSTKVLKPSNKRSEAEVSANPTEIPEVVSNWLASGPVPAAPPAAAPEVDPDPRPNQGKWQWPGRS